MSVGVEHLARVRPVRGSLGDLSRGVAVLGLLVLFPGFFIYHYAVAQGWIPAFAGGLFGVASAGVVALSLPALPGMMLGSRGVGIYGALFMALVVYCVLWSVTHVLFGPDSPSRTTVFWESLSAIVLWIAMMLVGMSYPFESRRARAGLLALTGGMLLLILHAIVQHRSLLGPYLSVVDLRGELDIRSTYQGFGRSAMVTAVFVAAYVRRLTYRGVVLVVGLAAVVSIGARAELVGLVMLLPMIPILMVRQRSTLQTAALLIVLAGFAAYGMPYFLQTRGAEILDLAQSQSWQVRRALTVEAVEVISANPVIGSHGYHSGDTGSGYAHNALSAWAHFGLGGFLLYMSAMVVFTWIPVRKMVAVRTLSSLWFAALGLNVISMVLVLAAVPVFSVLPPLAWGLTLNAVRSDRMEGRSITARAADRPVEPSG